MSWTLDFFRRYGGVLTVPSLLRLRRALLAEPAGGARYSDELEVELAAPYRTHLVLRPASNDLYTLGEVLIDQVYRTASDAAGDAGTIIDLGANIGMASLYFAARHTKARLFAVEAARANVALLRRNLEPLANAGRAESLHAAAWFEEGELAIREPESAGHTNQLQVCAAGSEGITGELVPARTVPGLIVEAGFTRVDLMKIDIEGAEAHLFRDDAPWLAGVRTLTIEFHGEARRASDFDAVTRHHGMRVIEDAGHTVTVTRPVKS